MAEESPIFKLRMAKSYLDEVLEGRVPRSSATESVKTAIALAREAVSLDPDVILDDGTPARAIRAEALFLRMAKSYLDEGIEGIVRSSTTESPEEATALLNGAIELLDGAIALAREAVSLDPDVILDDGTPAQGIRAEALFQLGLAYRRLALAQSGKKYYDNWHRAQRYVEESHQIAPTQGKLLCIATCMLGAMRIGGGTNILKCGGGTIYYAPILREKQGKEYIREFLKSVIEMNPSSEAAVEAGKLLMDLK